MPELPREALPDKVKDVLADVRDDRIGWFQKAIIVAATLLLTNPMTLVAVVGVGSLVYLVTKGTEKLEAGQRAVVVEMRAAYESMETRRELREDKTDAMRAAAIDRLASALDRNTDAVRGRVFVPKTSGKDDKK